MPKSIVERLRRWWWMLNPQRGLRCGILACKCRSCTTEGCDCAEWNRG